MTHPICARPSHVAVLQVRCHPAGKASCTHTLAHEGEDFSILDAWPGFDHHFLASTSGASQLIPAHHAGAASTERACLPTLILKIMMAVRSWLSEKDHKETVLWQTRSRIFGIPLSVQQGVASTSG